MRIYFDASSLFKAYWPDPGSENVEWVMEEVLSPQTVGITSNWSLVEITRGFCKRRNLGELSKKEADEAIEFFLSDTRVMKESKKFSLANITEDIISLSIEYVRESNLYAADATHLATAIVTASHLLLVDDKHFQRFKQFQNIQLLPITQPPKAFQNQLQKFLQRKNHT